MSEQLHWHLRMLSQLLLLLLRWMQLLRLLPECNLTGSIIHVEFCTMLAIQNATSMNRNSIMLTISSGCCAPNRHVFSHALSLGIHQTLSALTSLNDASDG